VHQFWLRAQDAGSSRPGRRHQNGKKKTKSTATQRPYVINGITYYPIPSAAGYAEMGLASWYGEPFHGRRTANGEIYDMYGETAAHKTLPMDTILLVKNLENGKSSVVRINDRGPFVQERIIDLSYSKAQHLGIIGKGTAKVEIVALGAQTPAQTPMRRLLPENRRKGQELNQRPKFPKHRRSRISIREIFMCRWGPSIRSKTPELWPRPLPNRAATS
jgi:rare lipoprotein A